MFINTLPGNTGEVLNKLRGSNFINNFYLTGGTALSLQIGHRESQDLDFFSQNDFQPENIQKELETLGRLESLEISQGTLNCFLDQVKLQFLHYPYSILETHVNWEGIQVSSTVDIACTKLITISVRGSKKDFIDMYFLLNEYYLSDLFEKLKSKYPKIDYNETHILKSLVYFVDADEQPMPRMHKEVSWEEVKREIIGKIKAVEFK